MRASTRVGPVRLVNPTVWLTGRRRWARRPYWTTLAYTACRAGAVAKLRLGDLQFNAEQFLLRFQEKGGKSRGIPVRHAFEGFIRVHLEAASIVRGGERSAALKGEQRPERHAHRQRDGLPRGAQAKVGPASFHQGTTSPAWKNPPFGPSSARVARVMPVRAPSCTEISPCVLPSVCTLPGCAALALCGVPFHCRA